MGRRKGRRVRSDDGGGHRVDEPLGFPQTVNHPYSPMGRIEQAALFGRAWGQASPERRRLALLILGAIFLVPFAALGLYALVQLFR